MVFYAQRERLDHLLKPPPANPVTIVTLTAVVATFPSAPSDIALNMVSKILAFVVALSLFLPRRAPVRADSPR